MKNTILLSIFILSIFNTYSQSTGATPANTVVSDNSNGENDGWANMGNIAVSDNSRAEMAAGNDKLANNQKTEYLKCINFGYTIPVGSIITGVEVKIERRDAANKKVKDEEVKLVVGGVIVGSNYKKGPEWDTESTQTYGGPTDLWGTGGLTAVQVNAVNFGMVLSAKSTDNDSKPKVDLVSVNIYYTSPPVLDNGPGSGNSLEFDGNNDYVEVSSSFPDMGNQSFTMMAWIKPDGVSSAGQRVWCDDESNGNGGYALSLGDPGSGRLRFYTRGLSPVSLDVSAASLVVANEWQHVAMVHDAGAKTKKIYINGVEVASGTYTGTLTNISGPSSIGGETDGGETSNRFKGEIDEVSFWTSALSSSDIRDNLCLKQVGNEASLIGYWRFDESTGSSLADHTSNAYHGTLTNMSPGSDWVTSGASLGNSSTHLYTGSWVGQEVFLVSPEGDSLRVSSVANNPDGVHIYHVSESPNVEAGIVGKGSNDHYYGVFKTGGAAPTYTATYYYGENDAFQSGAHEPGMMVYKRDDNADITWVTSAATLNTTQKTLTMTNLNTEMFLGNSVNPLPIELVSFAANVNLEQVDLKWITSTEINNDYFTIERSVDAQNWEEILTVNGAGNSNQTQEYYDIDYEPLSGASYYRLKQTDYNGKFEYFNIVPVKFEEEMSSENGAINLFPSPVRAGKTVNVEFKDIYEEELLIVMRDIKGREFYSKMVMNIEDGKLIGVPIESSIPPGVYLITATSENQLYSQKLIVK
ncbi:T9SS type A sorting domain-containing protein [Vicingaceae bacterium]|nr:T9SS type A sorting domain-containing protein [Vicingaceae bacterium]